MATGKRAKAGNMREKSVFTTAGGKSYLENLERLHPTDLTRKAIERAKAAEQARSDRK